MRHIVQLLLAPTLSLAAATAANAAPADDDAEAISEAYQAIRDGKFELAIAKADDVIARFEARREPNAGYRCASGGADTLSAMLGAALAAGKGKSEPGRTATYAISPDICSAYFMKGFAQIDLGRRDDALANFETAIAMDPDNNHYLNELGEWYKTGRQWEKSLEIFTRASETEDLSLSFWEDKADAARVKAQRLCRSYRGIAFAHVEMAEWKKARAALDKCLAIVPNDKASLNEIKFIEENS
jgi:tetratricopeptide (TPR) repeat protein